jgi:hypothetical protein
VTSGQPARRALLVIHATAALLLAVPVALWLPHVNPRFLDVEMPVIVVWAAPAVWFLVLGVRVLGRITPGLIRALRWTHGVVLAFGVLVSIVGLIVMYRDSHSGGSAPGLQAAPDVIVVAAGVVIGTPALVALWLVRRLRRAMGSPDPS